MNDDTNSTLLVRAKGGDRDALGNLLNRYRPYLRILALRYLDSGVRQRVDPGDASAQIESNTNVVSLPVSQNLFANFALNSPVITPNGDGVNDELRLSVDLVNLLQPRPLRMRLYDLAGHLVYDYSEDVRAGQRQFSWDGRDRSGTRVAPGVYVLEIAVDGDAGDERAQEVISIVY